MPGRLGVPLGKARCVALLQKRSCPHCPHPRCGNGPAPAVTGGAAVPQSDGCTGSEWVGPRHQRGTAVEHYAGIDVSLERSSVCVVDATGRIVREAKVASEPEALVDFFRRLGLPLTRVGLEAGPLSQWLHAGLTGLWSILGDEGQAAACSSAAWTGSPSRKRTPSTTWARRSVPSSRRQWRSAPLASLKTIASAVSRDRQPFVLSVRSCSCSRTSAAVLANGG